MSAPTIKNIAATCGVSHSTVSRALNGNPRIPAATRARILRTAEELGYRPDAAMNELMARVRMGKQGGLQGTLALLHLSGTREDGKGRHQIQSYVSGVHDQADQLGYSVDSFWLEAEGLDGIRLKRILSGRGIAGVILVRPGKPEILADFPWESFAWVALGFAVDQPPIHMVTPDWSGDAAAATRALIMEGHERIGFVWQATGDPLVGNAWLGGYATEILTHGREPLIFRSPDERLRGLVSWVCRERPTALVIHSHYVEELLEQRKPATEVVYTNLHASSSKNHRGVITSCFESGVNAVDVAVGQLRRGERGVPRFQKKLRTHGRWADRQNSIRGPERADVVADSNAVS